MHATVMLICFCASLLGPMCGIGGGSIIKPCLDMTHAFTLSEISFISSISVICMSLFSLSSYALSRRSYIVVREDLPVALSGAVGGFCGRLIFTRSIALLPNENLVGSTQTIILLALLIGSLYLSIRRDSLTFKELSQAGKCFFGFLAGLFWVFLSIGGGPFNMILLTIFFMLPSARAKQVSLLIVLLSQLASLGLAVSAHTLPALAPSIAFAGGIAGVIGAQVGKMLADRFSQKALDRLYDGSLVFMIGICLYNLYYFMMV